MKKVYIFEVTQIIEIEAETSEEALDSLPLPHNGFEGQGYYVTEEEIFLRGAKEVRP